ncbi:helix-turn-helix domain-containing protein [Halocatena halophila]|uniref:helix-turn-helix domain-containing protein n=1 Tax=Halocatena halophila TaxID=2814576 RepID=UPI002ED35C53
MQEETEIKLEEKLSELLAVSDKSYNEVANEIGVSSSSIAQYRKGQSRPSLENLVALADVFDVTLDFLVFGEKDEHTNQDYDPVIRHVDKSLGNLQDRTAERTSLLARVGRTISESLDEQINDYLKTDRTEYNAGIVSNRETICLEEHSIETKLVLRNFEYNLANGDSETPGQFFNAVSSNISQDREYKYLLVADADEDWETCIGDFTDLLSDHSGGEMTVARNCKFRITDAPLIVGYGVYNLDRAAFEEKHEILYEFLMERNCMNSDGCVGYVAPPSIEGRADSLMDNSYLTTADRVFDELWENAREL